MSISSQYMLWMLTMNREKEYRTIKCRKWNMFALQKPFPTHIIRKHGYLDCLHIEDENVFN